MDNIIIKLVVEKPDVVVDLKIDRPDVKYSELVTNMFKGERGEKGEQGLQGERGEQGIQGVKGDKGEQGIQGIQGETGNGIESIIKSSTNGLVDTYTILYTNGNTQTFNVTNGADGKDGQNGKDATIVGLNVSVDNTTGTPNATATMGGTPSERTFNISFSGLKGEKGADGVIGKDGKSAFEYAQDGGYTGTEEDFASDLGDIATKTYVEENGGKIDVIEVNDVPQEINDKKVKIKVPTDNNELVNGANFITNQTNNLVNYTLTTETGSKLGLSINDDYLMTLQLLDKNNNIIDTKTLDFPIESMVVNATYSNGIITLVLQNGTELPVNVSSLVKGLVPDTRTINGKPLTDNITLALADLTQDETHRVVTDKEKQEWDDKVGQSQFNQWVIEVNARDNTYTQTFKTLDNNIKANEESITGLEQTKANVSDLDPLETGISTNASNIESLTTNKADKTEIPTKTSQLTNDSGFLTEVPQEYVTNDELTAKGYLTSVPSEYVTDTELTAKGYETITNVDTKNLATLTDANNYTDGKIAELVGTAPETLDTIQEVAQAIKDNESVVDALNSAVGNKVDKTTTINGKALSNNVELSASDVKATPEDRYFLTNIVQNASSLAVYRGNGIEGSSSLYKTISAATSTSSGVMSSSDKEKLDGIETGAQVNVQTDWNETDTTSPAYLKNKPDIPEGSVLYDNLGQNTDGSVNQKVITDSLKTYKDFLAVSNSSQTSTDLTATIQGIYNFTLYDGLEIFVKFTNGVSFSDGQSRTLNINNTGAKSILAVAPQNWTYKFKQNVGTNDIVRFVYDGEDWLIRELVTQGIDVGASFKWLNAIKLAQSSGTDRAFYGEEDVNLSNHYVDKFANQDVAGTKNFTTTPKVNNVNVATVNDIPTDYVSESELNAKGYLTAVPSEYITETELTNKGYATTSSVESKDTATLNSAKSYTDTKVAGLVNSAPETLDTLGELATALQENAGVVETLNSAIGNKVDKVSGKGLSTNDYTTTEKNKLAGIASGAEVNVQSDWNATSGDAFIKNKPTIPTKTSDLTNDSNFLTSIPSTYKTKTENDALYQPKGNYLTSYTETDPTVPSHVKSITTANITSWNNKSNFSGSYNDLTNKPTIPSKTSQLTNDSGFTTFSGNYNDLTNKPTIPSAITIDTALSSTSTNPVQNKVVNSALSGKQATLVSGTNIKTINNQSILGSGNISVTANVTVDSALSTTSTNPVQNKIVTGRLNTISNNVKFINTYKTTTNVSNGSIIDLSDILPDTTTNYMVLVAFNGWGNNNAQNSSPLFSIKTSLLGDNMNVAGGRNPTSNGEQVVGFALVPVGTDRKITLTLSALSTSNRFSIFGYWRSEL